MTDFELDIRLRIALLVSQTAREVQKSVLESWLNMKGGDLDEFVREKCGWDVKGDMVIVPLNKENEAKGTVVSENVKVDQFSRIIKRAYEQPV